MPGEGKQNGNRPSQRCFFPCNREDALLLLGGLAISEWAPDVSIQLAMQPDGIALVDGGLRASEASLLENGVRERFPVLFEVNARVQKPRVLTFADVEQLVFRTREEADAFRLRAVQEFDPVALRFAVEPDCFGLPEEKPRFTLREPGSSSDARIGHIADRLAAGIAFARAVAKREPASAAAFSEFISGNATPEELDLYAACVAMTGIQAEQLTTHQRAIVSVFSEAEGLSRSAMLDAISRAFAKSGEQNDDHRATEAKWVELARRVIRNEMLLDGKILSDDRSILLRGTLLSLVADTPDALCAFINAENPAGPKVAITAAFLSGLKSGLISMPWSLKASQAVELGTLAAAIMEAVEKVQDVATVVRASLQVEPVHNAVVVDDAKSVDVPAQQIDSVLQAADSVEAKWEQQLRDASYEVVSLESSPRSWRVSIPRGYDFNITMQDVGGEQFPLIIYRLGAKRKLKNKTDVAAAEKSVASMWLSHKDPDGGIAFVSALPQLPSSAAMKVLAALLGEVMRLAMPEARPSSSGKSGGRKSRSE